MSTDETFTLNVTGEPNIRFTGYRVAERSGLDENPDATIWEVFAIYRTKKDRFVCARERHSRWIGDTTQYDAHVCDNAEQVVEYFGHSELAKALYEEAEIEDVVDVD